MDIRLALADDGFIFPINAARRFIGARFCRQHLGLCDDTPNLRIGEVGDKLFKRLFLRQNIRIGEEEDFPCREAHAAIDAAHLPGPGGADA